MTTTSVNDGKIKGEESPCTGTDTQPNKTDAKRLKSLTTKLKETETRDSLVFKHTVFSNNEISINRNYTILITVDRGYSSTNYFAV